MAHFDGRGKNDEDWSGHRNVDDSESKPKHEFHPNLIFFDEVPEAERVNWKQ